MPAPQPPVFQNFRFERLRLTGRRLEHGAEDVVDPLEICGFAAAGHEVQDVVCKDLTLPPDAVLRVARCRGLTLENLRTEDTV